jgi:hypothetical protein
MTGRVHRIEPDRKFHGHPNRLPWVVIFPLAWYEGAGGSHFDLWSCRKQYFKGER